MRQKGTFLHTPPVLTCLPVTNSRLRQAPACYFRHLKAEFTYTTQGVDPFKLESFTRKKEFSYTTQGVEIPKSPTRSGKGMRQKRTFLHTPPVLRQWKELQNNFATPEKIKLNLKKK